MALEGSASPTHGGPWPRPMASPLRALGDCRSGVWLGGGDHSRRCCCSATCGDCSGAVSHAVSIPAADAAHFDFQYASSSDSSPRRVDAATEAWRVQSNTVRNGPHAPAFAGPAVGSDQTYSVVGYGLLRDNGASRLWCGPARRGSSSLHPRSGRVGRIASVAIRRATSLLLPSIKAFARYIRENIRYRAGRPATPHWAGFAS